MKKETNWGAGMGIGIGSIVKVQTTCSTDSHLLGQIGKVRAISNGHFGHVVLVSVKFPGIPGIHKFYPDELKIEYHTR